MEKDSTWVLSNSASGFAGEGYMSGTGTIRSAKSMTYKLNFTSTGKFYVHIRTFATGSLDNGLYVSLDNRDVNNGGSLFKEDGKTVIYLPKLNKWSWGNQVTRPNEVHDDTPYFEVTSTGEHVFKILQREQNVKIDQIVVSKSATV